jgi:hypothetical protein
MSGERRDDALWRAVATLPAIAVDEGRAGRVRAQCRRALERNQRAVKMPTNAVTVAMLWTWNAWHTLLRVVSHKQQSGRPGLPVSGSARS